MIRVEFAKQLRRSRTAVLALICVVVPLLVGIGLDLSSGPGGGGGGPDGGGLNFVTHHTGLVVGVVSLSVTSVLLIPIVFAIFAGDTVASEAKWGSLRYLLVRPISRPRLLASKLVVALVLSVVACLLIPAVGVVVGVGFFGWHPVQTFDLTGSHLGAPGPFVPRIVTLSALDVLGRLALATGYVLFSTLSVLGVAAFVGMVSENTLAGVSSGIGLYIVSAILDFLLS